MWVLSMSGIFAMVVPAERDKHFPKCKALHLFIPELGSIADSCCPLWPRYRISTRLLPAGVRRQHAKQGLFNQYIRYQGELRTSTGKNLPKIPMRELEWLHRIPFLSSSYYADGNSTS